MSSVTPISFDAIAWAFKEINRHLMSKGWVVAALCDEHDKTILDVKLIEVGEAIREHGFEPLYYAFPDPPMEA